MLGFILDSPPLAIGRLLPPVSACMPIYNPRANKSVDKTLLQEELERPGRSCSPQAHSEMTIIIMVK